MPRKMKYGITIGKGRGGKPVKCPYCQYSESKVVDSRATDEHTAIRRRRECNRCKERFTTYERVEELPLIVLKKDEERELFNRNKIIAGLLRACEKRDIPQEKLEDLARYVEQDLRNRMEQEVTSESIGELVMDYLLELDEVAYVRFASVYRHFKDIKKFRQELDKLLGDRAE